MSPRADSYKSAGVDIDAGGRAVELMRAEVESTHNPHVLSSGGDFGGMYALDDRTVLVSSTDSVGTKVRLAAATGEYRSIGVDLVNHCVNDILTCGARPLYFLDYFASSRINPAIVAEAVGGASEACREAGCALLGGETAELPGVYHEGEFDLAGFITGVVERDRLLDGSGVREGDVLVALPSSGLHTNGFSLVSHILTESGARPFDASVLDEAELPSGRLLREALLTPHRSYLHDVRPWLDSGAVSGIAHITGGGLTDNLPRVPSVGLSPVVDLESWTPPELFVYLQRRGEVSDAEMYRVFNMGVGLVLFVPPEHAEDVVARTNGAWRLGRVEAGDGAVVFRGGRLD